MSPIQQMLLGVGAVDTKTYVDDVFSTYLYKGTEATQNITNGIDLATEGGMVWAKGRNYSFDHRIFDTEQGTGKYIRSNEADDQETDNNSLTAFNTTGFTLGSSGAANMDPVEYASWTFRKAPGFFDVVKWTGNATIRDISHNLGSVPGMIIIKNTSSNGMYWIVYHKSIGETKALYLNTNDSKVDGTDFFSDAPTDSVLKIGTNGQVNANNSSHVAYLFAGGESGAATARSVSFDSSSEYLEIADSSDFDFGSTFTFEAWVKPDFSNNDYYLFFYKQGNFNIAISKLGAFKFDTNGTIATETTSSDGSVPEGQWTHVAAVCSSGNLKLYINGVQNQTAAKTGVNVTGISSDVLIGKDYTPFKGEISNLRIVKGTAVYTSSFRPPTEPLANITNTVLLCCNNSSVTGSTVTPNTITANGSPTASTDSPFDDPAGFVFGDAGDQNVIKCGSYVGNGDADGPEIFLGFEPSWIMLKRTDSSENWGIFDTMRGIVTGGSDYFLRPNTNNDAATYGSTIEVTPTGFKLRGGQALSNISNAEMIYVAIRRPDGYCGKLPELGTDVFAMDTGAGSSTIPNYDSNFPVDFAIEKYLSGSQSWFTSARLIAKNYVETDNNIAEVSNNAYVFDSNVGWFAGSGSNSSYQSWMWKRHAGFDVTAFSHVVDQGDHAISYSLSKTAEMWWLKKRDSVISWYVWHKGLNGGTNTQDYYIPLNGNGAEESQTGIWGSGPTSTHMTLPNNTFGTGDYLLMFFASTDVSKVGFYTGDGTSNGSHEITCGFTPRFLIIKCVTSGVNFSHWRVWDSLNGLDGSGNESYLKLNDNGAKVDGYDYIDTTSTGFKFNTNFGPVNGSGNKMIYYAHA